MLLKEYRILLPMTVDEYRIAQLYMIQKKSRIDSSGAGSGVEILKNEPYIDGPGAWIRSILPSSALEAHEEAWNAYPFTKTRYSSPMLDRLQVDVETVYLNDAGTQENVFHLTKDELKHRHMSWISLMIWSVVMIIFWKKIQKEYKSKKTGRGPLSNNWIEEYTKNRKPLMCAYKLCRVEFRYWGMQTRVERWIQDLALRNTMLRAHRQAWAWQDEWVGLTIDDIRRLEQEAALYLQQVMKGEEKSLDPTDSDEEDSTSDIFFDCLDQSPSHSQKPSLIRWSSELLIGEGESPPSTPKPDSTSALLILVFHGDIYPEAVQGTINRANQVVADFLQSEAGSNFNGEIYAVGDCIGGLLMYEALTKPQTAGSILNRHIHKPVSRHSSSLSMQSRTIAGKIPESPEIDSSNWPTQSCSLSPNYDTTTNSDVVFMNESEFTSSTNSTTAFQSPTLSHVSKSFPRNLSAPPSASYTSRKKMSTSSIDGALQELIINTNTPPTINFKPTTAFLLGYADQLECEQLFNLYYPLDSCGARLEPVLNSKLAMLHALNVPRYQRYPLGDGRHIFFDSALATSTLWGSRRIDHQLYCPAEMISLPSAALPNILHASYWESKDVGAFILRQFVRSDDNHAFPSFSTSVTASSPLNVEMPPASWNRRRTRFKIVNLSANHRANDIITVEGSDQIIHARFCYGPMDLVALSREEVIVFICPSSGEWYQHSAQCTDTHGRLTVNLNKQLPVGIHAIKMIVRGDHSFLNMYIAVVPASTSCVVFSIDGSLTGSVSVTGRDPRVRPGAVDVVRYWQQLGYLVIYVTARPDMQQRVVGAWLAQHNFPHGLLFFTPSISTDPLRHKTQHIRHLIDIGLKIQAAYGSSKDVSVYSAAGVDAEHIFKVSGSRRRGCVSLEDGYAQHLHDLHAGRVAIAQSVVQTLPIINEGHFFTPSTQQTNRNRFSVCLYYFVWSHGYLGMHHWRGKLKRERVKTKMRLDSRSGANNGSSSVSSMDERGFLPDTCQNTTIEKEGWLQKWTNYIKGYRQRWFVLDSQGNLSYYRNKNEVGVACRGSVNLQESRIHVDKGANVITISGTAQSFHLKANNEVDRDNWLNSLEYARHRAIKRADSDEDESIAMHNGNDLGKVLDDVKETLNKKLEELRLAEIEIG
ncbi:Protein retinal degeneration B [Aphelenchoides besseyi]|nr:Protein retinal degeneration B [Aphelenchoides besseyi]